MSDASHQRAARAFARLLAGEIRLYNEEDVIRGRRHGDLPRRLDRPLREARERYLSRYGELDPLASLLRSELAAVLTGGDPALLN